MEIARKISSATLVAGHNLKKLEAEKYLGRIYGVISGTEAVATQFGEATRFTGEFVAVCSDGEMVTAPSAYLPDLVSKMFEEAFNKSDGGVKFGFDFYVVPSEKSKVGYIWKAQPLMEVKPSESMLSFSSGFPPLPVAKRPEQIELTEPAPEESKPKKSKA